MALYRMEEKDAQNCLALLNRVQLTGAEAESCVIIKQALRNPIQEASNVKEDTD